MGTPQTLDDFDLPVVALPSAGMPTVLFFEIEGTAEQLPKRLARTLQLYGFKVRIVEEAQGDARMDKAPGMG